MRVRLKSLLNVFITKKSTNDLSIQKLQIANYWCNLFALISCKFTQNISVIKQFRSLNQEFEWFLNNVFSCGIRQIVDIALQQQNYLTSFVSFRIKILLASYSVHECMGVCDKIPNNFILDCLCTHFFSFIIGKLSWFICYPLTRFLSIFQFIRFFVCVVALLLWHSHSFSLSVINFEHFRAAFYFVIWLLKQILQGYFITIAAEMWSFIMFKVLCLSSWKSWNYDSKIFIKCQNVTFMKIAR